MALRIGDEVLVRIPLFKWNGGDPAKYQKGLVVVLDYQTEEVGVVLHNGKIVSVSWAEVELLRKSIFWRTLVIGIRIIAFLVDVMVMIIGLVPRGLLLASKWIRDRFKKEA